jgi:uncharacterized membrane protein
VSPTNSSTGTTTVRSTGLPATVAPLRPRATDRPSLWSGVLWGAAAGAAGTTALNAVTYLDMAVRGRSASQAPAEVVRRLAGRAGTALPGGRAQRANRAEALGALSGSAVGVGVGAVAGLLRRAGLRLPTAVGGPLLGTVAMAASDVPLAALGISDPRSWSRLDWISDVVPHLVYGVTTHAALVAGLREQERRAPVAPPPASVLARAAALGAASGCRSSAGLTAVALTSARTDPGLAGRLASGTGRAVTVSMAAGELVVDKLPSTPSRLGPPSLAARTLFGGSSAAVVARRDGHDPVLPALVGALGAVGMSVLGTRLRGSGSRWLGTDLPGAFAEDGLAALLGWLGARRPAT